MSGYYGHHSDEYAAAKTPRAPQPETQPRTPVRLFCPVSNVPARDCVGCRENARTGPETRR